jgi:carbamoyltransferase
VKLFSGKIAGLFKEEPQMSKSKEPWILGISASHNGAVCLLKGDEIVVAIQEERLNRKKRQRIYGAQHTLSLDYCFEYAGIHPRDLSMIVISVQGRLKSSNQDLSLNPLLKVKEYGIPTLAISHHFAHAVSAFGTSGFGDSAVLVIDGVGSPQEDMSEEEQRVIKNPAEDAWEIISLYSASGVTITPLEKHVSGGRNWLTTDRTCMPKFRSLGGIFSASAVQIFGGDLEAGKVMGLAPYGRPVYPTSDFFEIVEGRFMFNDKIPSLFQHADRWPQRQTEYENLACSAQNALEVALLYLVDHLYEMCPSENFSYAGGVALNSVANERIIRESKFKNVYIKAAAEDSGPAIGAAYYGLWQLTGQNTRRRLLHDAVGRQYPPSAVAQAIAETPAVEITPSTDVISDTVDLLTQGKIIGWFQGRSELGPRALGQRSILCDTRRPDGKEVLNLRVKHREAFRPFAPVIPLEEAHNWFEVDGVSPESGFMLRVCPFKEDKKAQVPAVVHVDGTGRIQTVTREANGRFYDLVKKFQEKTGVPIVLNTSFNVMGMPIIETPQDAMLCLLSTGIDYCVLEDTIVKKRDLILLGLDSAPEHQPAPTHARKNNQHKPAGMQSRRTLKDYVGDYDNAIGVLKIGLEGANLTGTYNAQTESLVQTADGVFEATGENYAGFKFNFIPDKNGNIERVVVDMGAQGEAVFTRELKKQSVSKKFMRKCSGVYKTADKQVKVALRDGGKFIITVTGQPDYALVPGKDDSFDLKNTPGYSVEFISDAQENITEAIITQPNGSFVLKKVK